jgi:hypothetical protein
LEMGGIGLRYDIQQPRYSLSIIMDTTNIFLELKWPGDGEPILKGLSLKKLGSSSRCDHDVGHQLHYADPGLTSGKHRAPAGLTRMDMMVNTSRLTLPTICECRSQERQQRGLSSHVVPDK